MRGPAPIPMSYSSIVAKVNEGTRSDSEDLCKTCRQCVLVQGGALGEEIKVCHALPEGISPRIPFRVARCNYYSNKATPSLSDLYNAAWILSTDKKKKTIGFSPYREWKDEHDKNGLEPYTHE